MTGGVLIIVGESHKGKVNQGAKKKKKKGTKGNAKSYYFAFLRHHHHHHHLRVVLSLLSFVEEPLPG